MERYIFVIINCLIGDFGFWVQRIYLIIFIIIFRVHFRENLRPSDSFHFSS